ncbi:MAG: non-ribosomal peptide synthetase, partial [Desulfobacteraceae bacterium]|nr:non-ribosomal peptide synthetase [Desulfobacteraceae bacterium]
HSLKATRVVSRISKELEVDVALKEIFGNPTIGILSEIINSASKTEYKRIEAVKIQESYEISSAQRRLWVLDQLESGSIAYNMPISYILEGELETDAFRQAFSFMVERHESLRTVFISVDGEPRQKILENPEYEIEIIDLRNSNDLEKEARILAEEDLLVPFNLETGPLVRFTIVRMGDEKNLLLFNMHHIISDGWSMNIFITEFLGCYNSYREGNAPDLSPLRIHYKDYSSWQNVLLESSGNDSQREYWLDKLGGELPVLDLPADNARPARKTYNGDRTGFVIPKEMNSALNDLCRESKVSLFMMLQALVKVLFHRYTGQTDIILGSPVAGRVHGDLEDQIGFYLNTLILRDTISCGSTFIEILDSVGKTCTEAFDNQDYPFDKLVEDLDIRRDLSRSPLFDVLLVLQNNERSSAGFDGLNLTPYDNGNVVSQFDIIFNISESSGSLFCGIEYNTDIYSEDRILRMGEHLKTLISSVIKNPQALV